MAEITWIKLKTDMFDNDKIKLIEALPDADTIIVIWIKLLATAGKANSNGYIMLTENIPMNVEEMATIFGRPLNTVRLALETFRRYGMIEVDENDAVRIANWEKHQNIDGMDRVRKLNADRNKKYRERKKQKALEAPNDDNKQSGDVSVTSRDGTEGDIEGDIDLDIDKEGEKEGKKENPPSHSSLIDINYLSIKNYYEQNVSYEDASYEECKTLSEMLDDYKDHLLIVEAMKIAVKREKPKLSYINGILKRWRIEDGITNFKQLQEVQHAKSQSNSNGQGVSRNPRKNETEIPKIFGDYTSPGI